jgi:nucleobase:cation symporter-1, NCS1 family
LSTTKFTGFAAAAMGHVDISWIVGLAIICPLYYVLMRPRAARTAVDAPLVPATESAA